MDIKTYFTSDTHFYHTNIIRYCNRPFRDVNEMNRVMKERWNNTVRPMDIVYHLGDFSFGSAGASASLLKSLNGKKILIRGNHDKNLKQMKEMGFDEVYDKYEWNGWLLQHHPIKTPKKLLCGHIHEKWCRIGWTINVGVDRWGFVPRTIEELEQAPQDDTDYVCKCGTTLKKLDDNRKHRICYKDE